MGGGEIVIIRIFRKFNGGQMFSFFILKKIILIFFLLSGFVKSQNLVPNWSFETYTVCPNGNSQLPSATPWFAPTTNSSDYYNACNN